MKFPKKIGQNEVFLYYTPTISQNNGFIAQLVEQRPFKAKVPGSSPGEPTISIKTYTTHENGWYIFWRK